MLIKFAGYWWIIYNEMHNIPLFRPKVTYDPTSLVNSRGRWSLVKPCRNCGKIMLDEWEMSYSGKGVRWAEVVGEPKARNHKWTRWKYGLSEDYTGEKANQCCTYCQTLRTCQACGKQGPAKVVTTRNDLAIWDQEEFWKMDSYRFNEDVKNVLCVGCWNKARAIERKKREFEETRSLIGKFQRAIANERKNQDNRAIAGLFGNDDARSEERGP